MPPTNSAALLVAALAASNQSSPLPLPQTATNSLNISRASPGTDASGRSLPSTVPGRITPALSSAAFSSGMGIAGLDGSDDDWDFGSGLYDTVPLDGSDDAGECQGVTGSEE